MITLVEEEEIIPRKQKEKIRERQGHIKVLPKLFWIQIKSEGRYRYTTLNGESDWVYSSPNQWFILAKPTSINMDGNVDK